MNNRRRNFRQRSQKNSFRRRNVTQTSSVSNNFNNNGNRGYGRNTSMNNIHSVEKAMQKFQQLAKDAQSSGDPVLVENYLQHADHFLRRFNELSEKAKDNIVTKDNKKEEAVVEDTSSVKEIYQANYCI